MAGYKKHASCENFMRCSKIIKYKQLPMTDLHLDTIEFNSDLYLLLVVLG